MSNLEKAIQLKELWLKIKDDKCYQCMLPAIEREMMKYAISK